MNIAIADSFFGIFGMKQLKPKTCRYCKTPFYPKPIKAKVCSPECAEGLIEKEKEKATRKDTKEKLAKLKTLSDWKKDAQVVVNQWVRLVRDKDDGCISCGTRTASQYHAGHYRSRGAVPSLALEECNINKQCLQCNNFNSGNIIEYRIRLLEKIGQEKLDWLEGSHPAKKYTINDLKDIIADYKARIKRSQTQLNGPW